MKVCHVQCMQRNCCIVVELLHNCIATWLHHCLPGSRLKMLMRLILTRIHQPAPYLPGQEALAKNGNLTRMEGPKCTIVFATSPRLSGCSPEHWKLNGYSTEILKLPVQVQRLTKARLPSLTTWSRLLTYGGCNSMLCTAA